MEERLRIFKRHLPHWRMKGSVYFLTWCVNDSFGVLPDAAKSIVQDCLLYFNQERYWLYAYVVMNDHVHVVVQPAGEHQLGKILHTWKSFSAHRINKLLRRKGSVWQSDTFDRIIRNEAELAQKLEYVVTNPQRRWPGVREYQWMDWYPQ